MYLRVHSQAIHTRVAITKYHSLGIETALLPFTGVQTGFPARDEQGLKSTDRCSLDSGH